MNGYTQDQIVKELKIVNRVLVGLFIMVSLLVFMAFGTLAHLALVS